MRTSSERDAMRTWPRVLAGLGLAFLLVFPALAQEQAGLTGIGPAGKVWPYGESTSFAPPEGTIQLLNGNLGSGLRGTFGLPKAEADGLAPPPGMEKIHALIQMDHIPKLEDVAAMEREEIKLQDYFADNAWMASIPAKVAAGLVGRHGITYLKVWAPEDKLHPLLKSKEYDPWVIHPKSGLLHLLLYVHKDISLDVADELVRGTGGLSVFKFESEHMLSCWVPEGSAEQLVQDERVYWIEGYPPPLEPQNNYARIDMKVDKVAEAPYNLTGSGVNAFVFDAGGALTTHEQFVTGVNRIILLDGSASMDHSTHVACTVAGVGDGTTQPTAKGMAPGAWILSAAWSGSWEYFWDSYGDLATDYNTARSHATHPADLATNSIGTNLAANGGSCWHEGNYQAGAREIDRLVRGEESIITPAYKRFIITWAAANERTSGTPYGRCGGGFYTIGTPAAAKNPITVGATNADYDAMTDFSSWGPTDNGRLKPVVTGPGCEVFNYHGTTYAGIYSATNTGTTAYDTMCGTSMATPAVAGVVALILERYHTITGTSNEPWNAAVKALLLHTAKDLGPIGPDYMFGFGRVDAQAAIDLLNKDASGDPSGYFHDVDYDSPSSINQGDDKVWTVFIPSGVKELRASLVWDDPASAAPSSGAIVNDLDLEICSAGGTSYKPWVLNPAQPWAAATTGVNRLDNTEQVVVNSPATGTWAIHVKGTKVPTSGQTFGLVYSYTLDDGSTTSSPAYIDYLPSPLGTNNGGFENTSTVSWTISGAGVVTTQAHSGSRSLQMGGAVSVNHTAYQQLTIPANATKANVSYWWRCSTNDTYAGRDWLHFLITDTSATILAYLDMIHDGVQKNQAGGWDASRWQQSDNIDLLPWKGQTVRLYFYCTNGSSLPTTYWVDDVRVQFWTPGCTPPSAPTPLNATANGNNRIDVSWTNVGGISSYRVYRSMTAGGPYTQVGTVSSSPYVDTAVAEGNQYFYVIRSYSTCESANSSPELSAWATGTCDLAPTFSGLSSVTVPANTYCTLKLDWSAATPECGTSVTYAIYRDTSSTFTPALSNRIAAGLSVLTYTDNSGLAASTAYFYIVRATDASNGIEDTNTVRLSGTTVAPLTNGTWRAGAELGDPQMGLDYPWCITSYRKNTGGTYSYVSGLDGSPPAYLPSECASLQTPVLHLTASQTSILTFYAAYNTQSRTDGGLLEILNVTDSGAWTRVTALDNPPRNYPSSFNNGSDACGYANNNGSFSGSNTTFTLYQYTIPSATYQDHDIQLRWNFSSDASTPTNEGLYIDDIQVTNVQVPASCNATPYDVQYFTARVTGTTTSSTVKLEWQNPASGAYGGARILCKNSPVTDPNDPLATLVPIPADPPENMTNGGYNTAPHTLSFAPGTTYYYTIFVKNGTVYSTGKKVTVTTMDTTTTAAKWAYSTGATSLAPVGILRGGSGTGAAYVASNDRVQHGLNPTSGGGDWPRDGSFTWFPASMNAPAQHRPSVIPFAAGPRVLLNSQDGYTYSLNAYTGGDRLTSVQLGATLTANPAGLFSDIVTGAPNLLFVGSRYTGAANTLWALNPATLAKNITYSFTNGAGQHPDPDPPDTTNGIGIINGVAVDYATNRVYFTTRKWGGGSSKTVWCVLVDTANSRMWRVWSVDVGDVDGSPILFNGKVFVGNNVGVVYALSPADGSTVWSFTCTGDTTAIKRFVYPHVYTGENRLYFSTTNRVWAIRDNGLTVTKLWDSSALGISNPSTPFLYSGTTPYILVGDGAGNLRQLTVAGSLDKTLPLGTSALGPPGFDNLNNILYLGSAAGITYAVSLPLP